MPVTTAQAELIAALQAIRGIGLLSAVTIAAEAGDLRRFASARQFMAYVGLVPSEWSSSESGHRGRITKTGNRLIRHVLGQAAHNARYRPNVSPGLRARQQRVPPAIVELDRRAQARLHRRYRSLVGRIGKNKTVIAVARELAGFVWAAGQQVTPAAAWSNPMHGMVERDSSAEHPRANHAIPTRESSRTTSTSGSLSCGNDLVDPRISD